jgi:hypothetical protein
MTYLRNTKPEMVKLDYSSSTNPGEACVARFPLTKTPDAVSLDLSMKTDPYNDFVFSIFTVSSILPDSLQCFRKIAPPLAYDSLDISSVFFRTSMDDVREIAAPL